MFRFLGFAGVGVRAFVIENELVTAACYRLTGAMCLQGFRVRGAFLFTRIL